MGTLTRQELLDFAAFTDWQGRATIHGDEAVSTNGALLEPVLDLLRAGREG